MTKADTPAQSVPITRPLQIGLHYVNVPCPNCDVLETFAVELGSSLTVTSEHTAVLKLTAKAKAARGHSCGQTTVEHVLAATELDTDILTADDQAAPALAFVPPAGSRA